MDGRESLLAGQFSVCRESWERALAIGHETTYADRLYERERFNEALDAIEAETATAAKADSLAELLAVITAFLERPSTTSYERQNLVIRIRKALAGEDWHAKLTVEDDERHG